MSTGRMSWRSLTLALVALLATPPLGAERPNEPPYFAIRNARIVPVSGPVIENGTVVMARGLITAVGTDVAIPPEAWVIDGKGLTVYPGLIDALTNLGLQAASAGEGEAPPPAPAGPQAPRGPLARGPEDRPGSTPWEHAADHLNPADRRLENWREAGFTSAVTVGDRGILPGQAALINLAGERANDMVVRTPVALRVNLEPTGSSWSFPGSRMGVLAYLKQVFSDANHYGQEVAAYNGDTRSQPRPDYDRALEPLRQAVASRELVLIPATWARQIHRALQLGDELGANTAIYGAHQGYDTAEALAAKKTPVLVSLKWPERPRDADPDADEPLRVLRFRDRAPSTPAALHKAGVKFAFYSDGLAAPREVLRNAKKAIDAGLPPEAALQALTLSAAEIFGAGNRLGSLEPGKIANLFVATGDLFDEKTKVKMVFIDGEKYEVREPGRPKEPPGVNLTGKWTLTVTTREGPQERTAELTMTPDGTLSGTVTSPRGTHSITRGWVSGNRFSFTLSFTVGQRTVEATYTGTVEGNRLTGTASVGRTSSDFTGTRPESD